jgi:protein-disulfide isomerase/uncharacterized membrane protein
MNRWHRALTWLALALSIAGAVIAAMLVHENLAIFEGDSAQGPFCGAGGLSDCSQVAAHPASWVLGMPLALWGLLLYVVTSGLSLLVLVLRDRQRPAAASLGAALVTLALVADAWLGYLMVARIGAVCLGCVSTYAINLLLAAVFWTLRAAAGRERSWRSLLIAWIPPRGAERPPEAASIPKLAIGAGVLVGLAVAFGFTAHSVAEIRTDAREETAAFLQALHQPPEVDMSRLAGLPTRGPATAPIVVAMAGDFQCSWCRALAANLERLRREHPDKIRLIFLNSPLSPDCNPLVKERIHPQACSLAELAECAAAQGKFWEYHDYVFERLPLGRVTSQLVIDHLNDMGIDIDGVIACLKSESGKAAIAREVALCREMHLETTPSMVINGHVKQGGISPWSLREIMRALIERS